ASCLTRRKRRGCDLCAPWAQSLSQGTWAAHAQTDRNRKGSFCALNCLCYRRHGLASAPDRRLYFSSIKHGGPPRSGGDARVRDQGQGSNVWRHLYCAWDRDRFPRVLSLKSEMNLPPRPVQCAIYVVTALVLGCLTWMSMMWGVWGAPVYATHYIALLGA